MNFSRTAAVLRRVSVVATLAVLASASAVEAATFNVNTTADTTVAGGCTTDPACSLRDAATAASNAADPSSEVKIPDGRYELSAGDIFIDTSNPITFTGAGPGKTIIDGNSTSRLFSIQGVETTFQQMTMTEGLAALAATEPSPGDGGAIMSQSNTSQPMTLDTVVFVNNKAQLSGGAVAAPFENPGSSKLIVTNSLFDANQVTGGMVSAQGGAIFTADDATITNTTISGNSVDSTIAGTSRGGGIAAVVDAADTSGTTIELINSTVVNNRIETGAAGVSFGGGYAGDAPGSLSTTLESTNSIIAGNTFAGAPQDCGMGTGLVTASDNSISSDATCGFTDEGSLQNTDPKLGALSPDNGGPTSTHYPGAGSPTFDAGVAVDCPATDQRGALRPQGKACDIGAVEVTPNADLAVSTSVTPVNSTRGQNVTFSVDVTNLGPQPAAGVSVRLAPVNGTFVSATGATCSGTPITCTLPDIPTGGKASFSYVVNATAAGVLQGPATVSGTYADPDTGNNTSTAYSYVTDPASPIQPVQPKLSLSSTITKVKKGKRYRITARGKLTGTQGRTCAGFVLIDVKVKTRRTILRRTPLKSNCTYARTFEYDPKRIPRKLRSSRKQLFKVVANYTGTAQLRPARVIKNVRSKK